MAVAIVTTMLMGMLSISPSPNPHPLGDPSFKSGMWSQYNRGPTDSQIWYHTEVTGKLSDPDRYDGFIAVIDCDLVGDDAWIQIGSHEQWLHVFIFDCSGHWHTTEWMNENGILGEVDYYTMRELGVPPMRGVRGKITFNPLHVMTQCYQKGVCDDDEKESPAYTPVLPAGVGRRVYLR